MARFMIECPRCAQDHVVGDEDEARSALLAHLEAGTDEMCAYWPDQTCTCSHSESHHNDRGCTSFPCQCGVFMDRNNPFVRQLAESFRRRRMANVRRCRQAN